MTEAETYELLNSKESYRKYLFVRGFCITTCKLNRQQHSFLRDWNSIEIGDTEREKHFYIYTHPEKKLHLYRSNGITYFLIGHAYNPFSMTRNEEEILKQMSAKRDFWTATNELTGVFCLGYIEQSQIRFTCDAAGQQMAYYGIVDDELYITSHSQMVGSICNLRKSDYIVKLTSYKFYPFFGAVLPGDLSPFCELKRAQCNFFTQLDYETFNIEIHRFWPIEKIQYCESDSSYQETIQKISSILHKNMELISEKWPNNRAAISVTGGMDSKTTLACTNGLYDRFSYFSYDSLEDERVDAEAAHKICNALGLKHKIYKIPEKSPLYFPLDVWTEVFRFNSGCIGTNNLNDIKKRIYFTNVNDFDIEVKSWVDEIGRARYHKRFAKRSFPDSPTPRYLTSLYKAFFHNRALVRATDNVFAQYLDTYYAGNVLELVPWWDLLYWEFEWNAGEGLFLTGEQLFAYDITIPFNNRKLLELMLSVPLEKRIHDCIQKDVISLMNNEIQKTGIQIQDVSHSRKRALMERAYLEIHTRIPF